MLLSNDPGEDAIKHEHIKQSQLWRIKVSYVIGAIFFLVALVFSCMWAMALVNTGQPISQTFSYCLARDTATQIMFSAWWVFYVASTLIVCAILIEKCNVYPYAHLPSEDFVPGSNTVQHRYTFLVWLFVLASVIKLVSLLLILIFPDLNETKTVHLVFAGMAFGFAVFGCFILCCLRLWRREYVRDNNVLLVILLILNVLSVIAELVMAIMFITTPFDNRGVYEFTLALLVLLDQFYILVDFLIDSYDIELLFRHHLKSK